LDEQKKDEVKREYAFIFGKPERQLLRELDKNTKTTTTFGTYTVEDILKWLKSPEISQVNLRKVSDYMYNRSNQYKRLIMHYTTLPTWAYVLSPAQYDPSKAKPEAVKKQYYKTASIVENWNIKHEMQKMTNVAWRDDVFYGIEYSNNSSFFIQRINPDYCELSSIIDGTYNFAIDMSKIKEDKLALYPPIVTTMYNEYRSSGQRLQEVPEDLSWCIKACDGLDYPYPPFAGSLPYLFDIEDYITLQKERSRIGNYKVLDMLIPCSQDGVPLLQAEEVERYYKQASINLPDYIGAIVSPFKITDHDFEKSGGLSATNEVSNANETFWDTTGTSSLVFGNSKNGTSAGMKLSITADEGLAFSLVNQCERLINRHLKLLSGSIKFKITILPVTIYNQSEMAKLYQVGATYGIPVKSSYAAVMNMQPLDISSMNFIEEKCLNMGSLVPLVSSHTQSGNASAVPNEGGRPTAEDRGEELTDAGQASRDGDGNAE
jgi:hypothetical protein